MTAALKQWDRFWFEKQSTQGLGVFRILLGLIILYSLVIIAPDMLTFYSDVGVLKAATMHPPLLRPYATLLFHITDPRGVTLLFLLFTLLAVLFTVGYRTRITSVLLYVFLASFHERNFFVLYGFDTVVRCMLFFFMFAPSPMAFSWDERHSRPKKSAPIAQRMMQIQLAVIYFFTAIDKIHGADWFDGRALFHVAGLIDFTIPGVEMVRNFPVLCIFLTYISFATEISLPFLLWFKKARPYVALAGVGLHMGIVFFMTVPCFQLIMVSTYVLFFEEAEIKQAFHWLLFSSHRPS